MKTKVLHFITVLLLSVGFFNCNSQTNSSSSSIDRNPVVAGQFYPASQNELQKMLDNIYRAASNKSVEGELMGIIAPHAGYVYSGQVAASGYQLIDSHSNYDNIFILAPSHRHAFKGASIYNIGNYITPLGTVKVNKKLSGKLISEHEVFNYTRDAHVSEHSLEVQLPFLQNHLKTDFQIVPIVIGTQSKEVLQEIGKSLKPYLNSNNLFIISSDFSHYPAYEFANRYDSLTALAIQSKSPERVTETCKKNLLQGTPNMHTSMCGKAGILSFLYMIEDEPDISVELIDYKNSGDVSFGNKSQVVGYWSIAFVKGSNKYSNDTDEYAFTKEEKIRLLEIARETISNYVRKGIIPEVNPDKLTEGMKNSCGAFVTLHKKGNLRGCIGRFYSDEPLYKVVQTMAVAASMHDTRFTPVNEDEIKELDIEISVLTPMKKIQSIDEINLGRHGVYIKKGARSGTFLPQVATETGWSKEEFLGHCASQKAGIGWNGWKDADIFTYEAIVFSENELNK